MSERVKALNNLDQGLELIVAMHQDLQDILGGLRTTSMKLRSHIQRRQANNGEAWQAEFQNISKHYSLLLTQAIDIMVKVYNAFPKIEVQVIQGTEKKGKRVDISSNLSKAMQSLGLRLSEIPTDSDDPGYPAEVEGTLADLHRIFEGPISSLRFEIHCWLSTAAEPAKWTKTGTKWHDESEDKT